MTRTLTRKVALAALACLFLLSIAVAFAIASILVLGYSARHLAETTTPQIALIEDFNISMTRAIGAAKVFALGGEASELTDAQQALAHANNVLLALNPSRAEYSDFPPDLAAEYSRLYDQRHALLESTQQLIVSMQNADSATRERDIIALKQQDNKFDQLEVAVDATLAKDIAIVTGTIKTRQQESLASIGAVLGLCVLIILVALLLLRRSIIRPIQGLSAATTAIINGDVHQSVAVTTNDEIGTLQQNFNTMTATIAEQTSYLEQQISSAITARTEAELARAELADQFATVEEQRAVIREMTVPVLPLTPATMVMPLVGALDRARLRLVEEQALRALETTHVRHLIVDITGVPVVDTEVAQGLLRVVQAARLLGTTAILVGIRPEVAQALVGLGIELSHIITHSTLQSGIASVLHEQSI